MCILKWCLYCLFTNQIFHWLYSQVCGYGFHWRWVIPGLHNTVSCHYNAVKYITILSTAMQWLRQTPTLYSQKESHFYPPQVNYWGRFSSNLDNTPDSKVHGAHMGPIWGWQDPGGPMLAPWTLLSGTDNVIMVPQCNQMTCYQTSNNSSHESIVKNSVQMYRMQSSLIILPLWSDWRPGPRFNKKMSSNQYSKSHCGDKTVVRSSYLHNGISYTGKMSSLYWIGAQGLLLDRANHSGSHQR